MLDAASMVGVLVVSATMVAALAGCTPGDDSHAQATRTVASPSASASSAPTHPRAPSSIATRPARPAVTATRPPPPTVTTGTASPPAVRFSAHRALDTIRLLAGKIGPREASSASYRQAARWVERRLEATGYRVDRQRLKVPAGNSWGVDVPAGMTWNVVATAPGFDSTARHLVVGAHLDTVPQAPGAEDNASGISVLLELSRLAASRATRLPVLFVAFGAEEPRGDGDALHHFGSRAMVARMSGPERRAMAGMVSMDRVGVGTVVPVCRGGLGQPVVQRTVLEAARRAKVQTVTCLNQSSDHWSFELGGMPSARVGGTSYAGYHSPADVPSVVNPAQLRRVGALMWSWLKAPSR